MDSSIRPAALFQVKNDLLLDAVMKAEDLKETEEGFKAYVEKVAEDVKASVDQGMPVFWGVTLGKFPERGIPQAAGGHMRLIIGYNPKTHEILYSDTWGAGHELKRMAEDRAFAITHDAFYLRPL